MATRQKTAEERTRRLAQKPFEELDAAAERDGDGHSGIGPAARRAAVTALAAAVAGALGGAAKAMLDRRDDGDRAGGASESDTEPEEHEEEPEDAEQADPEQTTPVAEADPEEDDEDAEQADPEQTTPVAEADPEEDDEPQAEDADAPLTRDEHVDDAGGDPTPEQADGLTPNEAAAVVKRAKQQLQDVLGNEPESVSGLERSEGKWTVTLEVVEVRRVPESTDVLASYEVVLDDDGGIVQMHRLRRYRRSQVDEDR